MLAPTAFPHRYYAGPPLRVLKEPGTAFPWIPADTANPSGPPTVLLRSPRQARRWLDTLGPL